MSTYIYRLYIYINKPDGPHVGYIQNSCLTFLDWWIFKLKIILGRFKSICLKEIIWFYCVISGLPGFPLLTTPKQISKYKKILQPHMFLVCRPVCILITAEWRPPSVPIVDYTNNSWHEIWKFIKISSFVIMYLCICYFD